MTRAGNRLLLCGVLLAVGAAPVQAQGGAEIIRGRVFDPDSIPLAGTEVRVTGLATRSAQSAHTDARGAFTVVFANAEGEYLVVVRHVGFKPRALRLSRVGMSPILGSDVYLERASQSLDTIVVKASRTRGERAAIGEQGVNALADSLLVDDPARLMDLLLSIPGITTLGDTTFSVMGAAATQNVTTLEGITVSGVSLPPDALASTRIVTSSADPSRGGFAGGNVVQTLKGGTDIFSATVRAGGSNRSLVWNDPTWERPVSRPVGASGTVSGPLVRQKLRYNVSWSADDRTSDWISLLRPRASLLSQHGISLDSVTAVTGTLRSLGVPISLSSGPRDADGRNLRTSEVLDFTPSATRSLRISHAGRWSSSSGDNASLLTFPTRVNDVGSMNQTIGIRTTALVHGLLNDATAGVSYYRDHSDPFTRLPAGTVRIGTDFRDGRLGLASLAFGGGDGAYYENTWSGEASDELSWISRGGNHRVKVGARLALNRSHYFYFPGSPLLGEYTYLTLADLEANRPASYERVLTTTARDTRAAQASWWIGEEWRASDAWQWQGGVRFDRARPGTVPRYNPAVDEAFGVRTDRVPTDVGWSPRIGFTWASRQRRGQGRSGRSATLGGLPASTLATMPSALVSRLVALQRASTLPGIGVSATLGAYRGIVSIGTLADLVESTGLPGTRVTLSCVGDAVPIPDWRAMTDGPSVCADGSAGTLYSSAQPLVRVFDPGFRAPLAWRASVSVDGIRVPGNWLLALNGNAAYNINGQSTIDLNLNRIPQFHLPGESDRPVYVPVDAVVPASGAISRAGSRISPRFSTVSSTVSDLRARSAQVQATLSPPQPLFNRHVSLSLSYAFSIGRSESRGNSQIGTAGDPFAKSWVRDADPTHQFSITSSGRFRGLNFALSTSIQSGRLLTPIVSGDVNGDGIATDDRAFIPDPATSTDTSLVRQMNELLSHATAVAHKCLTSQFGRMAGANTCRTPWQVRFDLSASITPPSSWEYSDRLRLTFSLTNANGALVRALGLADSPLGRQQLSTTPNPTLLYVTGFDPATQQFHYRVNQLFGEASNYGSVRRRFAPSQLQLGVEYQFGGPVPNPIARGLGLREPPGGPALTPAERREAVRRLKRDPAAPYLALRDSLALTEGQVAQLQALSAEYDVRADTALEGLLNWVLRKGKRVFDKDLVRPLGSARSALGKVDAEYARRAQDVLAEDQRALFRAATAGRKEKP
jgi:Carboxypeptidase regulatory-like domain